MSNKIKIARIRESLWPLELDMAMRCSLVYLTVCCTTREYKDQPLVLWCKFDEVTGGRHLHFCNTWSYLCLCTLHCMKERHAVYHASRLPRHTPPRTLCSGGGLRMDVSRVNLEHYYCWAFACAETTSRNSATGTTCTIPKLGSLENYWRHLCS